MQIFEVTSIALNAIRGNKLRSILTLLGIVIGVFSIIGVMTAVDVLQNGIESGMSVLGAHTFQIQKFPRMASREEWLAARNRKDITLDQALYVQDRITRAEFVGIEVYRQGRVIQSVGGEKTDPVVTFYGENVDGQWTNNWEVESGRAINSEDIRSGSRVIVLGEDVHKKVFPHSDPVGQVVKVDGVRYKVVGTYKSKGASLGGSSDNMTVIPITTFVNRFGIDRSVNIMIKSKSPELYDDCLEESKFILRTARKVDPGEEDDFSIFSNDSMISQFNEFTKYVKMGVGFISFIALLAAGVGIMNIMLVSVSERIKEIGIRKAIGARKQNILFQFLVEAIVLCQIGGIVGIIVGALIGNLAALSLDIPAIIPVDWAILSVILCSTIGIVFGVYPAWKAANLDPIEALRYE